MSGLNVVLVPKETRAGVRSDRPGARNSTLA